MNYPIGRLKNKDSKPIEKYCWINADTTFEGLKKTLIEPDRVFIGDKPTLLKRVYENPTKFIKSLVITRKTNATFEDVWFNDFHIELNSSLIAIIGNKGSGKSAITDIISLCSNTHQDSEHFSFLTSEKFRKKKPVNFSEYFEATLEWHDNTKSKKSLSDNPDKNSPQRVKYIPQNYLEKLCIDVDKEDFEKEIKK